MRHLNWGWGLGDCWQCGQTLAPNEVAGICPPCRWSWPTFVDGPSARMLGRERAGCDVYGLGFRLREGTHEVLHRTKYGGFPSRGRALGRWMAQGWKAPPKGTVLVPVPLHWRRLWRRGFNPPQAIAEGLASAWDCELHTDLLERVAHRASLTASSRAERQTSSGRAYACRARPGPAYSVVLVDDVLTTGATFQVCTGVLENAGMTVLGGAWLAMA